MPSNHRRRRLRVFAALPPIPLFLALPLLALLLLSAPLPAASGPISCPRGNTWDPRLESCRACSICSDPKAPIVVVPCEPHRDTQCGSLAKLGIDWSFADGARRAHQQQQQQRRNKRPGEEGPASGAAMRSHPLSAGASSSRSASPPPLRHVTRVPTTPPPPRLMEPASRRHPRPRTQEDAVRGSGVAPEVAARLMDLEALPSGLRQEDLFHFPEGSGSSSAAGAQRVATGDSGGSSVDEEGASVAEWGWRHWLAAGVSMAVVCALVLVLAPSALKGLRKRCSHPGSKGRHRDKEKGQNNKIVKSDQALAKSSQRKAERGRSLHPSSHHTLRMDELLVSGWGSQRQESKNVYVEDATGGLEKLLPPKNSSVLVASISRGMVQTVKVELQEDEKDLTLSTDCLRIDCASRTMFIGRSSAV